MKPEEIIFGQAFTIEEAQAKDGKMDLVAYNKDKAAASLGQRIMERKGWVKGEPSKGITLYQQTLFVFTHDELEEYVKSKVKG